MKTPGRRLTNSICGLVIFIFLVLIHIALVGADAFDTSTVQREINGRWPLFDCPQFTEKKKQIHTKSMAVGNHQVEKDIDIIVTYTDTSGTIRIKTVKSKDLSASWVWKNPIDDNQGKQDDSKPQKDEPVMEVEDVNTDINEKPHKTTSPMHPAKLKRRALRQERRDSRTALLIQEDKKRDTQMEAAAIERAKNFDTTVKAKYSIWRKEYGSPNSDSTVKLMRDQIIMAKAYATIAKAKNATGIYESLIKHSKTSQEAIGEASYDSELGPSAVDRAKEMGHILSLAKDQFYDSILMARKLRVMLQSRETSVEDVKKKSASLAQLAAKTVPRPLHCLPLVLTTDYFLLSDKDKTFPNKKNVDNPSLYHYAIFSDNVLATSVVVNSTTLHAKEPEKHVFHIVTDKLNFAAMKMWFLVNPPEAGPTIEVENVDDFTWLNASYCPVLRQLESSRMREYYFKAHESSSSSGSGTDNLKYRNPKYLSMLNHLRFYLPEVYPKLDKILFLDDDIVIQKDLTPLWSVNLGGMVNGAVETCKESFHRFDKYLNFSNPKICDKFSPDACGWAFGMNMFDLKEWRKRDITGIYHRWQNMNEDRSLWKLGTLPPGLITFYNLTHPLERSWHVLGLGYDPALNHTEIENAAVLHYNGNYKPWLDLAIAKYKSYWSRHVKFDNPYLQLCNINTFILS